MNDTTRPNILRPISEEDQTGAARVFAFFRDRLMSGELKAGDRLLPERVLALALGVSRPVLREALRSLSVLGLLDIQHGRGAFVRAADASVLGQALTLCLLHQPNIIDDVLQARIAIECQAIRLACERASERDLQTIGGLLDALVKTIGDPELGRTADHAFHAAIVQASDSGSLMKIYEAISPLLRQGHADRRPESFSDPATAIRIITAHRDVFLALVRREPDAAERLLREHFRVGDELRRRNLITSFESQEQQS
ncbi:MAG: FadR/GntR family transcriptional regulator [Reyranella sp.]